ncbi:glycosyltransferase family 9 protein [Phenylobacterium sp.]|uniref:glycosyltransferase family 9 protein n=1 Tax=Phenylobacterium sp. TaxID=1871053 RepID=UPI00391D5795
MGDQIMFARFAARAASEGADVTVLTPTPLARLFRSMPVEVVEARGAAEFPDPDYWVMSSDIAGRAGATLETLPSAPYLSAQPGTSSVVGVAWRGNPAFRNDANRSLPPDLGERLLALPGAVSLAPEDSGARDFQDTAEIIAGLDLVVSVDTAVAHLAGALGKPVWILVPDLTTDWRWMQHRIDSPWYPTARLWRGGDWRPVVEAIERELAR